MTKLNGLISNTVWQKTVPLCWRISLAILGSYIAVSIFSAAMPNLLATLFSIDKATVFLWMMILSFLFYSLLALWIISSRDLLKTSAQLTLISILLFLALQWSTTAQLLPEVSKVTPL